MPIFDLDCAMCGADLPDDTDMLCASCSYELIAPPEIKETSDANS